MEEREHLVQDGRSSSSSSSTSKSNIVLILNLVIGLVVLILASVTLSKLGSIKVAESKQVTELDVLKENLRNSITSSMDTSFDPCEDLYSYSCNGWAQKTEIPQGQVRISLQLSQLANKINKELRKWLTGDWPVVTPFYNSCLNTDELDKLGKEPIMKMIDEINNIQSKDDYQKLMGKLASTVSILFDIGVGTDAKAPKINQVGISQAGFTLLAVDYKDAPKMVEYKKYIEEIFKALGEEQNKATNVLNLETKMASFAELPLQLRDPYHIYNKYTLDELKNFSPFKWDDLLTAAGFDMASLVKQGITANIDVPSYITKVHQLFMDTDIQTLIDYAAYRFASSKASYLGKNFREARFNFFSKFLSGADKPSPREDTCSRMTNQVVGFPLGRYFVQTNFSAEAKTKSTELIEIMRKQFLLQTENDYKWIDAETRPHVTEKLEKLKHLVGYPDDWTKYYGFQANTIDSNKLYDNMQGYIDFNWNRDLNTINNGLEREDLWGMVPQEVNAYYAPDLNEIVIPAAQVVHNYYDINFPHAVNYGSLGATVGHECTHSLDDEGRNYNGNGKLGQTWTAKSIDEYNTRAHCIVEQYNHMKIAGTHVNGSLTLGENLADCGGTRLAYNSYHAAKRMSPQGDYQLFPDMTNEQLFFVSFAQTWCSKATPQYLQQKLKSDPHAPSSLRVNGVVANMKEFAEAFKCSAKAALNPPDDKRCVVW